MKVPVDEEGIKLWDGEPPVNLTTKVPTLCRCWTWRMTVAKFAVGQEFIH